MLDVVDGVEKPLIARAIQEMSGGCGTAIGLAKTKNIGRKHENRWGELLGDLGQ
jgi:hypothetical protein